ncbi:MAG: ABC transporter permease [Thermofilum sp.]|nr:ABC transporter permease [Thermofilum sp.]MCC6059209.1 ABC transporter permease [Thermofilum sp.]
MRLPRGFAEWGLAVGTALVALFVALALAGESLVGQLAVSNVVVVDGRVYEVPPLLPPGSRLTVGGRELVFIMGTDQLGRDVFARVVSGARFVLTVALLSTAISAALGTILGLLSGYVGGFLDRVLSLVMDSMYAFPGLILAIAIAALLGVGVLNISMAIAVVYIPSYYRMVRGVVLSLKSAPFVEAAVIAGASPWSIVTRHILPNVVPQIVSLLPVSFADAIITEAGLTFLGLGIEPPTPDWGFDLNKGRQFFLAGYWWIGVFPGLMIILSVLGFLLVGESLNELLNPRKVEA